MNLRKTFQVEILADEIAEELVTQNEEYIRECIAELFDVDEDGRKTWYCYGEQVEAEDVDPMQADEVKIELYASIPSLVEEDDLGYSEDVDVTARLTITLLVWDIMANSDTAPIMDVTVDSLEVNTQFADFEPDEPDDIAELEAELIEALNRSNVNPFVEEPRYLEARRY